MMMRKVGGPGGGGPGGIFNIGKSKATLFEKGTRVNITFADVAGLDEAKVEVMEIVDFLKNRKNILHSAEKFERRIIGRTSRYW
jgi:cell division protease FtsH